MKFSLFLELQIAGPTPELERRAFGEAVEQAVLAETLGYHGVWAVEHHGLLEYSHCSAPEVLLAFVAARTSTLSLGHAVTLTPYRYNHPIRVAERVATLDVLSEGRVRWGSGKSSSRTEQGSFEIDPGELDSQWREALEMIPRMWGSDVFEWDGDHFHIPPTAVIPKPVQKPHPPVFVACSRPETVVLAGELGAGSLNFAAGSDDYLVEKVRSYRDAVARSPVTTRRVNDHFCSTPACIVLPDHRRACEIGFRGARFFREGLGTYFFSPHRVVGGLEITRGPLTEAELAEAMRGRSEGSAQLATVIGDPVAAREAVSRFQAAGVDELILVMQMGTVPHEVVIESMRTFAERVMPEFS